MFKNLFKFKNDNTLLILVCVLVILVAIFWPRQRNLAGATFSAHLGNIGGKVQLEALETLEEGFESKTLALFYAPWCGFCKKLMPEWEKLNKLNNTNIKIVKVNCDENSSIAEAHGVKSYPTVYFLPYGLNNPRERIEYTGPRTGESLLAFISNK